MVDFRKAYDTWTSVSLVLRIIIALVVGIVVALVYPHSKFLFLLGDAFIWALKAVAPFLVFFLVITAIPIPPSIWERGSRPLSSCISRAPSSRP